MKKNKEKIILILLVIATFVMTILRFLWNEKGRVNPDSLRFMRTSKVFPERKKSVTGLWLWVIWRQHGCRFQQQRTGRSRRAIQWLLF